MAGISPSFFASNNYNCKAYLPIYCSELDELINTWITSNPSDEVLAAQEIPEMTGSRVIKIAVTADLPPLDYVDASGNASGFNVALLSAMSEVLDVKFELVEVVSSARLAALQSGKVDAIFYTVSFADVNDGLDLITNDTIAITDSYYTCGLSHVYKPENEEKLQEAFEFFLPDEN